MAMVARNRFDRMEHVAAMNRQPFQTPPRWWSPKLSRAWVRFWSPARRRMQLREQRLVGVDVRGVENMVDAVGKDQGVLVTPNHSSHADCYAFHGAADRVGCLFNFMIAWQVFQRSGPIKRMILRQHGCFSVDREGTDMRAFRQALDILKTAPNPLVVFPEGEVYHCNERITPFREGPAAMAILAARKGDRPVVCVPCAMKYEYVEDPTPALLELADRLERAVFWRPRPDLTLPARIYHLAEGLLALKEIEFFGHSKRGELPERIAGLIEFVLQGLEGRYETAGSPTTVPERIKALRQSVIEKMESVEAGDPTRTPCENDLGDLFLVVQAFSYPGNYVAERPSIERIAETLDKLEEDVLGLDTATIRGTRKVTVTFGEPIPVETGKGRKTKAADLTRLLEERVQGLLDAP